jgi:hypothetical protein
MTSAPQAYGTQHTSFYYDGEAQELFRKLVKGIEIGLTKTYKYKVIQDATMAGTHNPT